MTRILTAYVAAGVAFLAIDAVWLTLMASRLYRPLLGDMLAPDFAVLPAVLFYLIFIGGAVFFAVMPGLAADRWQTAAFNGAVFGFCAYATYDLTNQATLKNWPWAITLADLCWGTLLCALASAVSFVVTRRVFGL